MSCAIVTPGAALRRGEACRGLVALLALLCCLACGPARPEPVDPAHLAGRWTLDTGEETEWFHLERDGTFTADLRQDGFFAKTLSQGPRVEASGHWSLADRTLTLAIDASQDGALVGQVHTYTIEQLSDRELVTLDAQGERIRLLRGE